MEWTELSSEEQAQFLEDAAALSGTSDNSVDTETETTTDNSEEVEATEEGTEEVEVKESKSEKKIKKLLSKKNQAEKENESLKEKVERLERESETNKFHAEYPDARWHSEKIDALLEEKPWFSREDAYFFLQGRWEIQTKVSSNGFVGRPNSALATSKDPTKGTTAEMNKYLKDNFADLRL
jgi:hypothetical protein